MSEFTRYKHGLGPYVEGALRGSLPTIRGRWFGVDPYGAYDGKEPEEMGLSAIYTNLKDAYGECTSGTGDGIVILSGGTGTSAHSTSYLDTNLAWTKHGITVYGAAAPNAFMGRARIASRSRTTGALTTIAFPTATTITDSASGFVTAGFEVGDVIYIDTTSNTNDGSAIITAVVAGTITCAASTFTVETAATAGSTTIISYCAPLITITGENNAFYNLSFINNGAIASAIGGVFVNGSRNYFSNCHFNGQGHVTAAAVATTPYDMKLAASECVFDRCYFGSNSTIRAAANAHIVLGNSTTQIGQNFFNDCLVISYSATAGHGGILIANAVTLGGYVTFNRCSFVNWDSGAKTALTTTIIGETPNNCGILLQDCAMVGWAAWGANNDTWFTSNAAGAAGTGGIAGQIA